jgi:hypothetical protein
MPIIKLGEAHEIKLENMESCLPEVSADVLENFRKFATNLKKIAPKAEDFLYFSAVMMHAAEAAALNDDGTPRLTLKGEPVQVGWDKSGNTWKWTTSDSNVKPYKNSNGDIFPEEELIKAYKKWKHKPLCVDHKSSSVDHVRGFIVDTYYDRNLKRVIALCALDKAGFPQLARHISTGVSNCVSMGTAVGRAICYDCGRVARAEADFCNHMKNKTCYGEINVDLNPIELSIVMNGADPRANIKHIIAAANTMNTYLENKQKELKKLAEEFNANLSFTQGNMVGNDGGAVTNITIKSADIDTFRKDVDKAIADFTKLQSSLANKEENMEESGNDLVSNQSSGSIAMDEGNPTDSGLALQTPQTNRFASADLDAESLAELQSVTAAIEEKLNQMKQSLDKLAKTTSNTKQEENMSGSKEINKQAYFQGGGGVNEPTPGQVKYPKDGLNEQLREHEDKHMTGQPPFPEVGPVDGMHPSPGSVDPSNELERKKMLARAEAEERAMKRNAIVNLAKEALKQKEAYWQGGGGVNEPTPGKPKYPKDKLNEELREYEDKHMTGQPPFPGVGPVDGLHPSPGSADPKDELKRKEMLARAGYRARFVKAANNDGSQNRGKSAWEVFHGDRLLLSASVADLCGGKVSDVLYDSIATKDFGAKLIEKVKVSGAEAVSKLIKKAQVPPPPGGGGAPPAGDPSSAPPPGGDMGGPDAGGPPAEDAGKSGDPKSSAMELAEKVRDLSSDLVEAVRALTGDQAEMGGSEPAPAGGVGGPAGGPAGPGMADDQEAKKKKDSKESTASENFSTASLNSIRREINGQLLHAMKESVAELNEHQQELDMIVGMYDKGAVTPANQDFVGTIVEDALNEAKTAVADGFKLMTAFIKYACGTKAIVKRAEIEAELESLAEGDSTMSDTKDSHSADGGDLMGLINDTNADLDAVHDMLNHEGGDEGLEPHDEELEHLLEGHAEDALSPEVDDNHVELKPEELKMLTQASLDTREGRALLRAKLAADATGKEEDGEIQDVTKLQFSDMLDASQKHTDGQTHLDTKPSTSPGPSAKFPLGLVETIQEDNKAMLEVAKAPPKVRKEAEAIQWMVSQGKLDPKDVDALVAEGLDKDAVAYWKKYYGEVDGGSEFATELVKEHVKAAMEQELNTFRVKLARAYELTYDMVDRGLCKHDRATITKQVDEIMKFNDDAFESLKKVVARHEPGQLRKSAGALPVVGRLGDSEFTPVTAAVEEDSYSQLSALFGNKKGVF